MMLTRSLATLAVSVLCIALSVDSSSAQNFPGSVLNTAGNSAIPSTGTGGCAVAPQTAGGTVFQNTVAGVAAGTPVLSVEINLTHTFDSDLDIFLRAPNGEILELTSDNGGGNDNYTNTIFQDGLASITTGAAPFTGAFAPEGTATLSCPGLAGNIASLLGFTPAQNGTWELVIMDDLGADVGTMIAWSISFGQPSDLSITKSHVGNFIQGGTGTYTITVMNGPAAPTTGTVLVTDVLPADLTPLSISGMGWNCTQPGGPCTRSDVLAPSTSYPPLTLTVSVSPTAALDVVNVATVGGGGDGSLGNNTASDPTRIAQTPPAVPMMSGQLVLALTLLLLSLGCVSLYRSTAR